MSKPSRKLDKRDLDAHVLTLDVLLQSQLHVRFPLECFPRRGQAPAPGELGANFVVLIEVALREAGFSVVGVARIAKLQRLARPDAAPKVPRGRASLPLDPHELALLDDADVAPCEVHQHLDAAREAGLRVRDVRRVVGYKAAQFEAQVVVEHVEVL